MRYLAVDFGSTYTKLTAVDGDGSRILGTSSAFTTIASNVMEGFGLALERLHAAIGEFAYDELLCCSSAAGGLAMISVGLVPELTAKAARMAAESAGAKVIRTYAYEISAKEQAEIYAINPDIILLSGGTDGGNKEVILANARLLAAIERNFSIIVAGNKSASRELEEILRASGKRYVLTDNVMPVFGKLNIEPARGCIRDIFIERIIDAKGLSQVQTMTKQAIIPTPLAVLKGCELLSLGTKKTPGIGDFVAIDLGGATTDVYSMSAGEPSRDNVLLKGLPEPYSKRTVEGDLGMRYSLPFLLEAAGLELVAEAAGTSPEAVTDWVARCKASPETVAPCDSADLAIDETLAHFAIARAVERHCGVMEKAFTPMGEIFTLSGKDLSNARSVIGIGGALKNSCNPAAILSGAKVSAPAAVAGKMMPADPDYYLDTNYIFSAMGLVSLVDAELALAILKKDVQPLAEKGHGSTQ